MYHVRTTANVAAMCATVTIMIVQYIIISVDVDMRTLLERKNSSSSSNGQVAAHRVTRLIIKALLLLIRHNPRLALARMEQFFNGY